MNGKITEKGFLKIERAGNTKYQFCPFSSKELNCDDWCPLFGEPTVSKWMGSPNPEAKNRQSNPKHWDLKICKTILLFDEFTDERA